MPTYDYKCDACDYAFEQFQSIKAETLRKCPSCGKSKLRRLIGGGAGLIFKGNGFYITDYRSESYKSAAKTDGGSGIGESSGKTDAPKAAGEPKSATPAASTPKPASKSD